MKQSVKVFKNISEKKKTRIHFYSIFITLWFIVGSFITPSLINIFNKNTQKIKTFHFQLQYITKFIIGTDLKHTILVILMALTLFFIFYFLNTHKQPSIISNNIIKINKKYYHYLIFVHQEMETNSSSFSFSPETLKFLLDLGVVIHFFFSHKKYLDFLLVLIPNPMKINEKKMRRLQQKERISIEIQKLLTPNFVLVEEERAMEIINSITFKKGQLIKTKALSLNVLFSIAIHFSGLFVLSFYFEHGNYITTIFIDCPVSKLNKSFLNIEKKKKTKFYHLLVNIHHKFKQKIYFNNVESIFLPTPPKKNILNNINNSKKAVIIGKNPFSHQLIYLPLTAFNVNLQIMGSVGKGKTTLVTSIINQISNKGVKIFIFDPRGEYKENISFPTIHYLLGTKNGLKINLGDLIKTEGDFFVELLEELLLLAGNEFTPSMLLLLKKAVMQLESLESPNLRDFVRVIKNGRQKAVRENNIMIVQSYDGLINRLSKIFSLPVFHLFNTSVSNFNLNLPTVYIFDFNEFLKQGKSPTEFYLISSLLLKFIYKNELKQINHNKLKSLIVFEESLFTFAKEKLGNSITIGESLLILGRAFGIGVILVTQDPSQVSNLLHTNTSTKIIFQMGIGLSNLKNILPLPNHLLTKIPYLPKGRFIITSPFLEKEEEGEISLINKIFSQDQNSRDNNEEKIMKRGITSTYIQPYKSYDEFKKDLILL